MTKKAVASAPVDDEVADDVKNEEEEDDDEDDDDEGDGEVFVVEKILNHRADFEDNEMRYEVKWKGYEKKSDRTWETEENLQGARLILEAYWAKLGGKPVAETKPATKKRGRQSTGGASEANQSAKKQKKAGRKSKSASRAADGKATPEPPVGFTEAGEDDWVPPKPSDRAWDSAVQCVDTIEKDDHGDLWAYLLWNDKNEDGRFYRSKARLATCNKACPQRMLQFYEKHVVFTNTRSTFAENGNTT
jgi:chromobox protein 1